MQKREAKYTTQVQHWIRKNLPAPCVYEIKHTRGKKSFALRELAPHQRAALQAATTKEGFCFKIPDCGYSNPFDGVHFGNMNAYVIIKFPDITTVIPIQCFEGITTPSLLQEEAIEMASYVIE